MMKKQAYMKPCVQVVAIKAMGILESSPVGTGVSNTEAQGDALSREGGYWGDIDF